MSEKPLTREDFDLALRVLYEDTVSLAPRGIALHRARDYVNAAEARYRSAELSVVACKRRREEAEGRMRSAEERAERLRSDMAGLTIYARGNDHVLGLIHAALDRFDAARGEA